MDERLRFVARLLEGEKMADCAGSSASLARPATRSSIATRTWVTRALPIVAADPIDRPTGCRFSRARDRQLRRNIRPGAPEDPREAPSELTDAASPAISTVHAVLDRHGLVKRRKRRALQGRRHAAYPAGTPNGLWCADFKGEFMLGNRQYCYPLTITDYALATCSPARALERTKIHVSRLPCLSAFSRTMASPAPSAPTTVRRSPQPNALFGLTKLAVWWLRLGINIERIKPGHPQQNGRHERMHLTLKKEATKPASFNFLQQQSRFDHFIEVYNHAAPAPGHRHALPGRAVYTLSSPLPRP